MKQLLQEANDQLKKCFLFVFFNQQEAGLGRVAIAAVTRAHDKGVPLETTERHCLSLQESPFGNEATKDSLHQCGSPLRRGHFNEQFPLYFPCGPIHCCGRRCLGGGGRLIETYVLII